MPAAETDTESTYEDSLDDAENVNKYQTAGDIVNRTFVSAWFLIRSFVMDLCVCV